MSVCFIPPYTPLLYSKSGVYRGIHYFLIFALKHTSEAVLTCTHNICFEQKYENSKTNQLKTVIFTAVKNPCMLHGRVFVMKRIQNMLSISVSKILENENTTKKSTA